MKKRTGYTRVHVVTDTRRDGVVETDNVAALREIMRVHRAREVGK